MDLFVEHEAKVNFLVTSRSKFTPVTNIALENGAFEDVFPIENGDMLLVYQMVTLKGSLNLS